MRFRLISIVGACMLIVYGILRRDPLVIMGQRFDNIIPLKRTVRLQMLRQTAYNFGAASASMVWDSTSKIPYSPVQVFFCYRYAAPPGDA